MKMSKNQSINNTANGLLKKGWVIKRKSGHFVLQSPTGFFKIPVPKSPSCHHASMNWHNAIKKIQRNEAEMV